MLYFQHLGGRFQIKDRMAYCSECCEHWQEIKQKWLTGFEGENSLSCHAATLIII